MPRIRAIIQRYEHQLSIGSFVVGFAFDSIALKRIDLLISNLLIYTYLAVVVVVIATLHYRAAHLPTVEWRTRIIIWLPFLGQFAFGGMFSGFLIFYSQSGSLFASWPFLLLILALIVTNEFLRKYQSRLTFQSLLLFFCLSSFAIYTTPILLGRMGDDVFEISGVVALVVFAVFIAFLTLLNYKRVKDSLYNILLGTITIYGLITALYFSNILPPIPLALKDIGIYLSISHANNQYSGVEEQQPWYARAVGPAIVVGSGQSLYAFSSVFAPTKLATSIVHEWQRYDTNANRWVTMSTVPFPISGGRDGGYRGYTREDRVSAGRWRVNVETSRGQLIGRETFTVVVASSTPDGVTRILQ